MVKIGVFFFAVLVMFLPAAAQAPVTQNAATTSTTSLAAKNAADKNLNHATATSAPATSTASANTCTLVGKVSVLPRKSVGGAKSNYADRGVPRIDAPDPPASVVWMQGSFVPVDSATAKPVQLEQQGLQFRPALLVVQVGTPVIFPNRDNIYHSVFSYSEAKKFDLGRFRPGEEPPAVVFERPGTISLFCEVHDHMRGFIVVVDTPHFVKTDGEGGFRMDNLPAGMHTFKIWLGPKETIERSVQLNPDGVTTVDWSKPA